MLVARASMPVKPASGNMACNVFVVSSSPVRAFNSACNARNGLVVEAM